MGGKSVFGSEDGPPDDDAWSDGLGGGDSSRRAYHAAIASGFIPLARQKVLEALYLHGPGTARELGRHVEKAVDRDISARLPELEAQNVAAVIGERACTVTRHRTKVQVWKFNPAEAVKLKRPKRHRDPCWVLVQDGRAVDCVLSDQPPQQDGETWVKATVAWVDD